MSRTIQEILTDLRANMEVYLDMLSTFESLTGDAKESMGKALDEQLDKCIRLTDELMRELHHDIVSGEVGQ